MFIFCVIVLSETDLLSVPRDQLCVSRASRFSLLPLAMCRLVTAQPGLSSQLAEWCLQLTRHKEVGPAYAEVLASCLQVFRYSSHWQEASVWGRLVPVK